MDKFANKICRKSRLGEKQRDICLKEPKVIEEIANGARMAIKECQTKFKNRRWNCPTERKGIRKVLRLGKRLGVTSIRSTSSVA